MVVENDFEIKSVSVVIKFNLSKDTFFDVFARYLVSLFNQINDLVNKQNTKADYTFVTLIKNKPNGIKLDYN